MFKITAYGARPVEVPYFKKLNKYDFELNLVPEMLNDENFDLAKGSDGVLVRGNCLADRINIQNFADMGIKYVLTRTVGYDHINLQAAKKFGIKVARVPAYSPFAVAELAMILGVTLFRKIPAETTNTHNGNFKVEDSYFSREIHSSTVGIIGTGHIGYAEASLYHGMGARVLVADNHPSDEIKEIAELVSQDELLQQADIVSLHVPLFESTKNLIAKDQLAMMKDSAILVNTARGPIVNTSDVAEALATNQIGGFGTDVLPDESQIFGHEFDSSNDVPNQSVVEMMAKYPNAIVSPHVGSFTEPALEDMINVSYQNFHELITTGTCENEL